MIYTIKRGNQWKGGREGGRKEGEEGEREEGRESHTHLGGDVVRSATEGPSLVAVTDALLAETKVSDLDVPLRVQHHIVQLQVTIDDATPMQVEQPQNYFCCIESM